MKDVQINLTVPEAEFILNTLGRLPYGDVYTIIHKIQGQVGPQLPEIKPKTENLKEAK